MVKGRAAIEALWKSMAAQVSDPKLTTLDVKPLGPSAAREIGTFSLKTKGATPQEATGKISRGVGEDRKRLEARSRYLERRQVGARSGMSAFCAAAHSALMAGDVHAMFDAVGSALPHIQSGGVRALGVTATARLRVLPDIPLIGDVVPGYAVTGWLGIGVPKGTPAEIVERLNREVNAALADPTVKARMAELGSEIFTGSSSDFAKLLAEETEKWAKVVKFAGIKAE